MRKFRPSSRSTPLQNASSCKKKNITIYHSRRHVHKYQQYNKAIAIKTVFSFNVATFPKITFTKALPQDCHVARPYVDATRRGSE